MQPHKSSEKFAFYILKESIEAEERVFANFIYAIKQRTGIDVIQNDPKKVSLSNSVGYTAILEDFTAELADKLPKFKAIFRFTIEREDSETFYGLRQLLSRLGDDYRIFSSYDQCFLPADLDILYLQVGNINEKVSELLLKFGLKVIFFNSRTITYYAIDKENKVRIVNTDLLSYLLDKEFPETELKELSYVVAPSLSMFTAMADKKIVPEDFYANYGSQTKIINHSSFSIERINRKVFIKPYISVLDKDKGTFYTLAGKQEGSSLLFMDKVRQGETLDQCIVRIIKNELNLADDYIAAAVDSRIEFDRDKAGIITPRLIVFVYLEAVHDKERAMRLSQTSWRSMDGSLPEKSS